MPSPCSAEIWMGSPRPSAKASIAPASPCLPSLLLATSSTGLCDRGLRLLLHAGGQRPLGALIEAGGVDDREVEIAEPGLALAAIAGDARQVIDKRELLPDQAVEQRRLADIGPADNGNLKGHGSFVRCRSRACQ